MARPMTSVALGAVAVAVALALHGCGGAVSNFATAVCQTTIDAFVNTAENDYQVMVENKCKELRDHANEQVLNANKSDELYHKCTAAAGAHVLEEVVAQKENYTNQCLDFINGGGNASAATWSQLTSGAHAFMQEHNFKQDLDSLLDSAVLADVQKMAADLKGGDEGGDAKGDEKGSDEKGGDEKGGDEKGSDAKGDEEGGDEEGSDEKVTTEKPSDEKPSDEKPEAGDDDDDDDEAEGAKVSVSSKGATVSVSSKGAKVSTLFDASIDLPVTFRSATVPVMFGAIATAAGLAVMVRSRVVRRDFVHESLANAEDAEFADA